jgi:hypothetical protein
MSYSVKDSGQRRAFETGAVRDMAEGKGRCDLLPFHALMELSKHLEAGAVKYGDENWRKGIPLRVFLDSAVRHLFKFALGMRDERHDLAALWNVACLIETAHMIERGILPDTLANLPDFFTRPDTLTDDQLNSPEIVPGGITRSMRAWDGTGPQPDDIGQHYPPDLDKPFTEMSDAEFCYALEHAQGCDPSVSPCHCSPKRKKYTRGHADETAARFNAGLSYRELAGLVADEVDMDAVSPRLGEAVNAALAEPDDIGQHYTFPAGTDALNDPAIIPAAGLDAIAGHPLFSVGVIDGEDAKDYDGPEVCGAFGSCPPPKLDADTDHLEPFVLVSNGIEGDKRAWLVRAAKVYFSENGRDWGPSVALDAAGVSERVKSRFFRIEAAGYVSKGEEVTWQQA